MADVPHTEVINCTSKAKPWRYNLVKPFPGVALLIIVPIAAEYLLVVHHRDGKKTQHWTLDVSRTCAELLQSAQDGKLRNYRAPRQVGPDERDRYDCIPF